MIFATWYVKSQWRLPLAEFLEHILLINVLLYLIIIMRNYEGRRHNTTPQTSNKPINNTHHKQHIDSSSMPI